MDRKQVPLFLIGYRGTGKSTVAQQLARRWGCPWHDSDLLIEERAGVTIREIFAKGETEFRALERQVVAELCRPERMIVSLGGGAILDESSRQRMAEVGQAVWLTATPEIIAERLSQDATSDDRRPPLTTQGLLGEIEAVLTARTPLYRQCAAWEVSTVDKSPEMIAEEIAEWWQALERKEASEGP